jgi:hypothetical protein
MHEFRRRHDDVHGAVALGALQLQHDPAFAITREPFVGYRGVGMKKLHWLNGEDPEWIMGLVTYEKLGWALVTTGTGERWVRRNGRLIRSARG